MEQVEVWRAALEDVPIDTPLSALLPRAGSGGGRRGAAWRPVLGPFRGRPAASPGNTAQCEVGNPERQEIDHRMRRATTLVSIMVSAAAESATRLASEIQEAETKGNETEWKNAMVQSLVRRLEAASLYSHVRAWTRWMKYIEETAARGAAAVFKPDSVCLRDFFAKESIKGPTVAQGLFRSF